LAGTGVFGKQTPGPGHCGPLTLPARSRSRYTRRPFSRSYGANLPSSLTEVLSSTWVSSTSPPVSVCGTGARALARGFSWRYGLNPYGSGLPPRLTLPSQVSHRTGFAWPDSLPGWRRLPSRDLAPRVPPSLYPGLLPETDRARDGNLDPLSIAYGASPRLRPASPAADQHGCGTLGHSVGGIRTPLALLMPTFALPAAPPRFPPRLHR
jgi:hypothetical protein